MKISKFCDQIITSCFCALFFLVPLILTPLNYELFEYNKMMTTYILTTIIVGAWFIKMIATRQRIFRRTPLDIPIAIFLISQLLSAIFSIDRHVSLWGYYSRFHGGLLSTFSYILLYYALVSNINQERIFRFLKVSLLSGIVVSIYGVLEHFGIDKNIWVQDVQNRVFATLGQPNWLAAYLAILIPLAMAFALNVKLKMKNEKSQSKMQKFLNFNMYFYYLLFTIYYLCLLYTKSRSGLLGFGVAYGLFWATIFWARRQESKSFLRPFFLFSILFLILSVMVGTPWTPSINNLLSSNISHPSTKLAGPALETGGTESGEIRKIVWKGAIEIARHYPLFGSGVETFAYSYYQFRPKEHNLVSEWDFLYNKAHNEYLNFLATTGAFGLASYLLLIGWTIKQFTIYNLQFTIKDEKKSSIINHQSYLILPALFSGYLSILVTNFFGFSVVPVAIYFWLIPAMSFVIFSSSSPGVSSNPPLRCERKQWLGILTILFSIFYFLFSILRMWYADTRFYRAYQLAKTDYYAEAYPLFHEAIKLNTGEPFYRDELAYTAAVLSATAWEEKEASLAGQLANEALAQNKFALTVSPFNVNFWKTRTKIFYALATIDEKYNEEALTSLLTAQKLAPTDAKISYNLGLMYGRVGKQDLAIKTLEETVNLKSNYQEARYALALFYNEAGKRQEAINQLKYILTHISTEAADVKEKLKEWSGN